MTKTEIANIALAKFREGRITTIESTTDPVAVVMNDQYDHALELLLEEHRWNFAGKRVTLTQLSDDPPFGWDHQYALPSDCIRLKDVNGEDVEASSKLFTLEGRNLLTNDDTVTITYVAKIIDTNFYSPSFVEALTFKLASITCGRLTGDTDLAIMLDKQYNYALSKAIHNDTKAAGSREHNLMQRMMNSSTILGGSPLSGTGYTRTVSSTSGTVAAHKHELTDLLATGATDGQIIIWNDTDQIWEAGDAAAGGDITTDDAWVADGDLIVGSGTDTAGILPIGAANEVLKSNGTTAVWDAIAGTGDVVGDASSVDNAIARFDGTTGKAIQNSAVTINDTTGNINMPALSTVDGRDLSVDGTKLDTIEDNADVTDTTNVTAAGALMDSEVDANIKTLTLPASTVIGTFGADLVSSSTRGTAVSKLDIPVSELGDTTITTPASDEILKWNGSAWINQTLAEAGIAAAAHTHVASTDIVATGTPSATTYLRGDDTWATVTGGSGDVATDTIWDAKGDLAGGTGADTASSLTVGTDGQVLTADSAEVTGMKWATASGTGDVTKVGVPLDNEIGVWTGDGTLEGDTALTFDGSTLGVTGDITVTGTVDGIDVAARDHNEVSIAASGGRDYVTISGTQQLTLNTVDLTADVSGLLPTGNIADDAVTYAKVQNVVANNVILGNNAGAGSIVDELTDAEVRAIINVEDGADVTDTANVTAAGALMDSEVDADIKTLSLPASTTISTFGASLVDDLDASAAQTTLGVDAAGTDNSTPVTINSNIQPVFTLTGQDISADDATADKMVFWDDSAGTLQYLAAGTGLSITGTSLDLAASGIGAYGSWHITTSLTNTANGTPAKLAGAGVTASDLISDFTHTTPNRLTYTGTATRIFRVSSALTCTHSTGNTVMTFSYAKNGTNDADTSISRKVGTGGDVGAFAMETLVSLATNDYIEIFCDADSAGTSTASLGEMSITEVLTPLGTNNMAEIGIACSDETTDLAAADGIATFRMPHAMTLTEVRATVTTAPTGGNMEIDINQGGVTLMTTSKLKIDAGDKTSTISATPAVITTSALTDDAEITVDLTTAGATVKGAGLKIWLIGTRD